MAGLTEVPVVLYEGEAVEEASLAENLARQGLSAMEVVEGVLKVLKSRGFSEEELQSRLAELRRAYQSLRRPKERALWESHPFRQILLEALKPLGMSPGTFLVHYFPLLQLPPDVREVYREAGYGLTEIQRLERNPALKAEVLASYRQAKETYQTFPVLPPGLAVRNLRQARRQRGEKEVLEKAYAQALRALKKLERAAARLADQGDEGAAALEEAAGSAAEQLLKAWEGLGKEAASERR